MDMQRVVLSIFQRLKLNSELKYRLIYSDLEKLHFPDTPNLPASVEEHTFS
jgi:hypothetical protein